jgi:hypothetical protein
VSTQRRGSDNDVDAEVVLVDRHDYHAFQPLLHQLATGLLETTAVGHALRHLVGHHDNTVCSQEPGDTGQRREGSCDLAPPDVLVCRPAAKPASTSKPSKRPDRPEPDPSVAHDRPAAATTPHNTTTNPANQRKSRVTATSF